MNVLPFLLLESAANIHGAEKKSVSVNERDISNNTRLRAGKTIVRGSSSIILAVVGVWYCFPPDTINFNVF